MKNQDTEKMISQELDGELDPAGRTMLIRKQGAMHADSREDFKKIGDLTREGASEGMPTAEAMWQDVQRGMRVGAGEPDKGPRWLVPWAVAAAIAVAVAVPFALKSNAEPMQSTATVEYLSTDIPGADIGSYVLPESEMTVIWVFEEESDEG